MLVCFYGWLAGAQAQAWRKQLLVARGALSFAKVGKTIIITKMFSVLLKAKHYHPTAKNVQNVLFRPVCDGVSAETLHHFGRNAETFRPKGDSYVCVCRPLCCELCGGVACLLGLRCKHVYYYKINCEWSVYIGVFLPLMSKKLYAKRGLWDYLLNFATDFCTIINIKSNLFIF